MMFSIIIDLLVIGVPAYFIIRSICRDKAAVKAHGVTGGKEASGLTYEQEVEARFNRMAADGWTKETDGSNPADYVRHRQAEEARCELELCRRNKAAYQAQIDQTVRDMVHLVKETLKCSQTRCFSIKDGRNYRRSSCIFGEMEFSATESRQYQHAVELHDFHDDEFRDTLYADREAYREIRRRFLDELRRNAIFLYRDSGSGTAVLTDADFPAEINQVGWSCTLHFAMEIMPYVR